MGEVADKPGVSQSQVALAWTLQHPAVVSPVMGARTLEQAEDNFGAQGIELTSGRLDRLNQAGAIAPIFPENFIGRPMAQQLIFGNSTLQGRR